MLWANVLIGRGQRPSEVEVEIEHLGRFLLWLRRDGSGGGHGRVLHDRRGRDCGLRLRLRDLGLQVAEVEVEVDRLGHLLLRLWLYGLRRRRPDRGWCRSST